MNDSFTSPDVMKESFMTSGLRPPDPDLSRTPGNT